MTCKTDEWAGCYDLGWGDLLIPAAYSHPAKMSRSLVFKIVAHALEEGWLQPGQTVLDPFGGVGTTALPSLMAGLNYIGVELEPRFVELGRQNIDLWNSRFSGMPKWTGQAVLLQGDSRRLAEVVGAAGLVVGSPPYASGEKGHPSLGSVNKDDWGNEGTDIAGRRGLNGDYGSSSGQLAGMKEGDIQAVISSPPFAGNSGGRGDASRNGIDSALFDRHSGGMKGGTGSDPANLDHLPMGNIQAVISSPPYAESLRGDNKPDYDRGKIEAAKASGTTAQRSTWGVTNSVGVLTGKGYGSADGNLGNLPPGEISAVIASPPFADSVGSDDPDKRGGLFRDEKRRNDVNLTGTYGQTEGQLGGMKAGAVRAVISSPPFENQNACNDPKYQTGRTTNGGPLYGDYGSTAGQIGATQGDTFWAAARLIVEQCALLLPTNGAAIWVVKNYVKGGKVVEFSEQWRQLCEACGFETVHEHRAMLVKEHAAQKFMLGGIWMTNKVQKKSFFRRLAEKNGAPPIDFETVLCMKKAA